MVLEIYLYLCGTRLQFMNNTPVHNEEKDFIESLKQIVHSARKMAYTSVNYAQVASNWLIGRRIVEEQQAGEARAEYGKHVIELASKALTEEFGKGFSETNISFPVHPDF